MHAHVLLNLQVCDVDDTGLLPLFLPVGMTYFTRTDMEYFTHR